MLNNYASVFLSHVGFNSLQESLMAGGIKPQQPPPQQVVRLLIHALSGTIAMFGFSDCLFCFSPSLTKPFSFKATTEENGPQTCPNSSVGLDDGQLQRWKYYSNLAHEIFQILVNQMALPGVPLLAVPQAVDQPANAMKVQ